MLELWHRSLADMLCLLLVRRAIEGQRAKDRDPAPLCALVEGDEKLLQDGRVDDEESVKSLLRRRLMDICEGRDSVCDDLRAHA